MASRGRGQHWGGRGRGRGGAFRSAKEEPFVLFPEIKDLPDAKNVKEELALVIWASKLQKFWNSSPYYFEGIGEAKITSPLRKDVFVTKRMKLLASCIFHNFLTLEAGSADIKKYSDKDSERVKRKPPLSDYMRLTDEYVPAELGEKKERHRQKKVRWNPDSGLQKLDVFEKLEQRLQGEDVKDGKEKKEGEDGEEDDENIEEDEEEYSTDGDYNQNVEFDDDEDDFNLAEENRDEPEF